MNKTKFKMKYKAKDKMKQLLIKKIKIIPNKNKIAYLKKNKIIDFIFIFIRNIIL